MPNNFQRGDLCPVKFAPAPDGGVKTTLNIISWSGDIQSAMIEVTHTGTNGVAARIAGTRDCSFTVQADFDLDAPPYATPPHIIDGISGVMYFFVSAGNVQFPPPGAIILGQSLAIQLPVIVEKVHWESAVRGGSAVKYSFDVKMNAFAGTLAYGVAA